jgi:cbb3-type cytochrome oxidase subunit 3
MFQAASDQAFCLMLISICLGACFVWAFWEIEEARQRRQRHDAFVHETRRSVKPSH